MLVTVVIPTHNRPTLLQRAIDSALAQEPFNLVEVLVVDDGSTPAASPASHPRLRLVRVDPGKGGAAARNFGIVSAAGRWITFLDDDDELLPGMVARCLDEVARSTLPSPVAAVTAIETVDARGRPIGIRHPPTLPLGRHWNLEPSPPGRSFFVKQSLFIEREVLANLGGFDASFHARVHSELFLRLNPECSIVGVDYPGYRHYQHGGPRVTSNLGLHKESFRKLIAKHGPVLRRHPRSFAAMVLAHRRRYGRTIEGARWLFLALRLDPATVADRAKAALMRRLGYG